MKNILFVLIALTFAIQLKAQNVDPPELDIKEPIDSSRISPPLIDVQQGPSFPGGIDKFYKYLSRNVNIRKQYDGSIWVKCILNKDGSIINPQIVQGDAPDNINKQILQTFKMSPKWNPANGNGIPFQVIMTIHFEIEYGVIIKPKSDDGTRNHRLY